MDPLLGQLLTPRYDAALVLLSYLISFWGALLALQCAKSMFRKDGTLDLGMTLCAAASLGGIGIWSMHFLAMQAYRLSVPISYDVWLTAASLLAAIVISGIALYLAGGHGKFKTGGWLAGSLLAGVGVCVMHYMGMYAMNLRATMSLNLTTVAISMVIAIVAAGAALWLAFNLTQLLHRIVAALVMALAVCSMHYVGMYAANMICTTDAPLIPLKIGGNYLDVSVYAVAGLLSLCIFWVVLGRSMDENKLADSLR
ncbi:MHYT domain-containing protein [Collimonas sp.]|jgi:NO-binding membrane sensor protein with MHYT domain|uniref:MHYT domain-containing protein n=1 Tax=Collimonas sp. TaxID=1963772 RepID=UPI002B5278C7|nr:MHYT domain-containing protein [Collimonas sp.]HWX02229.1 MHYT domain-containing protein [Collimonas sp.]